MRTMQHGKPPTCRLFDAAILDGAQIERDSSQDAYQVTLHDRRQLLYSRSVREGWSVRVEVLGTTAEGESVRLVDLSVDELEGAEAFWTQLGELAFRQAQRRRRRLLELFCDLFE